MRKAILDAILDASNDIDEYLGADVPMECHREDIDKKMRDLYAEVELRLGDCLIVKKIGPS